MHFLLMVAKFDAISLHGIFIQSQIFDGVAANFKMTGVGTFQLFKLGVGLHLDAGIAVISEARVVIGFQAEIRILFNGVVDDFDIIHRELAVIHSNAVEAVANGSIVFNQNIVAIVHIQTFAVVVIGGVVGEGYAKVIAACHGGDAVACATVCLMAVPGQIVVVCNKIFLIGNQCTGHAVVVQMAVDQAVVFTQRQIFVGFIHFVSI